MSDDQLRKMLAALIRQGASEEDLEAYTAEYEQQHRFADKALPATTNTGEQVGMAQPRKAGVGEQVVGGAETFLNAVNPFQDELSGVVAGVIPGGQGYAEARDQTRARVKGFKIDNPKTGTALEVAGTLAPALATGGAALAARGTAAAAKGANLAYKGRVPLGELFKAGSNVGAGAGAFYGFGNAEGDAASQFGQTLLSTLGGGVIGGVGPLAARAVGNLGRFAGDVLGVTTAKGRTRAVDATVEKWLSQTGQTADNVGLTTDRLRSAGVKDVPLSIALGDATEGVLSDLPALSSKRGVGGVSPAGRAAQMSKQAKVAAEAAKSESRTGPATHALYDIAESGPPLQSPEIKEVLGRIDELADDLDIKKLVRKSWKLARGLAKQEGKQLPKDLSGMTVTEVDYFKRGLDAIEKTRQANNKAIPKAVGIKLGAIKRELLNAVDVEAPVYGVAREAGEANIAAHGGRTETLKSVVGAAKRASRGEGQQVNPESALGPLGAGRTSIGKSDLLTDLIKAMSKRGGSQKGEAIMDALESVDPKTFMNDALTRQARTRAGSLGGTRAFSLGTGSILSRALGDQ
jgi:hypothetical protein